MAWPCAGPRAIKAKNEVRNQFHHVIDIAPTILEAAGLPEPVQVHGVTQKPIEGVSMAYTFDDAKAPDRHVTQYFEMFGNRGIYHQGWSAVTIHRSSFSKEPVKWEDDVWELYDGATDWSQAVNVADKYPEKLAELKDLFLIEAAKYNVFPLDDRRTELTNPDIAGRPDLLAGRTSMTFYSGMGQLMENTVPNVKNKSHTVTADIEVPDKANGVIIAQGGRFGGWSLYVKDGVLKYSHNYVGITEYPVAATEPLPAGRVTVQYKFTYEGGDQTGQGGTGALYVNNKKIGEAHIDKTVPFTYSLDETLDIGRDLATPVTADYAIGRQRLQRQDLLGHGRHRQDRYGLLRAAGERLQPPDGEPVTAPVSARVWSSGETEHRGAARCPPHPFPLATSRGEQAQARPPVLEVSMKARITCIAVVPCRRVACRGVRTQPLGDSACAGHGHCRDRLGSARPGVAVAARH